MSGGIAYLGPPGTFCEEALIALVGAEAAAREVPKPSITACFDAVAAGEVAQALVPIENAIEGGVTQTLDQLVTHAGGIVIRGEVIHPIRHHLIARPGLGLAEITRVQSHPHATAQCGRWLTEMLPGAEVAAALSTADGLLLTISSALSHDVYYKMIDPNASTARRVTLSKVLLLVVALGAAYVASLKPADILFLVSAAFSFAAAAFFPALTLGIFWKRATGLAASLGMVAGLGTTLVYMSMTQPWMRSLFGVTRPVELWWGIQPISAGVFGVPVGFAVILVVSCLTRRPDTQVMDLVDHVRYPAALPLRPEKRQV